MLCSVSHSVMKWVNVLGNSQYCVYILSSREQSATLSSSLNTLERSQGVLENKLGSMQDQHHQDASKLKVQLAQAESRTRDLQKEVQSTRKLFLWDASSYIIIDSTNLYHHWVCYKKHNRNIPVSLSLCSTMTLRACCQISGSDTSGPSRRNTLLMMSWSSVRSTWSSCRIRAAMWVTWPVHIMLIWHW